MRVIRTKGHIQQDILTETKECRVCGKRKSFTEFWEDCTSADKKGAKCKLCAEVQRKARVKANPSKYSSMSRKYALMSNYGVSIEEYDRLFDIQRGACAICGSTSSNSKKSAHFHVDHCHTTGVVRGLLCHSCNIAIGYMGDSEQVYLNAIEYLKQSSL